MNYDSLKLANQICFPLYACSRQVIRQYKPFLDKIGLTYTQYIVMMVLWEKEECTAKAIGDLLYLDSGTLTPLLKRLEADELIIRQRLKEDERNLNVVLTQKGKSLKTEAICVPTQMAKNSNLTKQENETLYKLLYKALGNSKTIVK